MVWQKETDCLPFKERAAAMLVSDLLYNEKWNIKEMLLNYQLDLNHTYCIPLHSSFSMLWTQLTCLPVYLDFCIHVPLCLCLLLCVWVWHIAVWVHLIVCNVLLKVIVCVRMYVRECLSLCVWGAWWRHTFGGLLIYTAPCPISSIRMWENKACTFPQPRACRENTHHN